VYKIKKRISPGLGLGLHLLKKEKQKIKLHTFLANDVTEFESREGYRTSRINSIVLGEHALIPDRLSLKYDLFYFQSLEEKENYSWRVNSTLDFRLIKKLSLTANFDYLYENIGDPAFENGNLFLTYGIAFGN
ncbi:DUF481 domain-containing protein, partial [Xanthovirga aplysinae]|uniref:DUF481 domain-containing protein n=1 Tax=Xanthovirga aplysinae TaxID=2529853 RepID=UPI0012BC3AA4